MAKPLVKVKGLSDIEGQIKLLSERFPLASGAAVYQESLAILAESQKKVPVDTGRLRSTGYVTPPRQGDKRPISEIGYGVTYAIKQHEATAFNHPGGGEAQYLKKAIDERSNGFLARLRNRILDNAEDGIGVRAIPVPKDAPQRPTEGGANPIKPSRRKS